MSMVWPTLGPTTAKEQIRTNHMEACRYRCSEWRHCFVVRSLTPPLRRIGRVVSQTMAGAEVSQRECSKHVN